MSQFVTTRLSLLLRIRDKRDREAWSDFVQIYAPLIYRYSRRMGAQDADAADLTQEVLQVVSEKIDSFNYDRDKGRFRSWLKTVAFYTCSQMKRCEKRHPRGTGEATIRQRMEQKVSKGDARFFDEQYSRRIFELAAKRVRPTVQPVTWDAFMATAIRDEAPESVAARLGMQIGSVYVAKNRVFAKIREALSELDER